MGITIAVMKHLLFSKFTVGFMINSNSYDGIYEVYFNFTTFFATFTEPSIYGPPCLSYNPVIAFKAAMSFAIISWIFQTILMRVSYIHFIRNILDILCLCF